jgi:hypothetical protein
LFKLREVNSGYYHLSEQWGLPLTLKKIAAALELSAEQLKW